MSEETTAVRLLFVDEGSYHHEVVRVPADVLEEYDRLIDCLREDPEVLSRVYVDVGRLCSATVVGDGDGEPGDGSPEGT